MFHILHVQWFYWVWFWFWFQAESRKQEFRMFDLMDIQDVL